MIEPGRPIDYQLPHVGTFRIELKTNQVFWSEELYRIYGFDPILPPPILTESSGLFTPESWNLLTTSIANTIATGLPYEVELKTLGKDNQYGWLWARGEAIKDSEGTIVEIWGVVQNITEQKRMQEVCVSNEERYRSLYANMSEGMALHSLLFNEEGIPEDYRIIEINPAFEQQLGVSRAQVIGKTSREAYGVDTPPYFEQYTRVATMGSHETFETYFEPLDKYFSISVYCPYPGSFATIFQNITDRKQAEMALLKSEAKLMELNATKDKFFSIIAHDLKSPFNGIIGFSDLLESEVRNLDIETIEKYAEIIHSTALQAYHLLENLLEWSKTQQDGFHPNPRKLLLQNMVSEEISNMKPNAEQKSISIQNEAVEDIILSTDEKMLHTILRNLLSNAVKFTPKGGLVRVNSCRKDGHVEVSLSDNGIGMDAETIDKLFKIDSGFTTRGTENEKGSGLGLLLCREFVEKQGGKIWASSEKGKGSTFTFRLPES